MNGPNKCPKFEKKFERERTANFYFCPSNVSNNLGRKTRWKEKCLHIVTRIPLTMSGANTDEYPYCSQYSSLLQMTIALLDSMCENWETNHSQSVMQNNYFGYLFFYFDFFEIRQTLVQIGLWVYNMAHHTVKIDLALHRHCLALLCIAQYCLGLH